MVNNVSPDCTSYESPAASAAAVVGVEEAAVTAEGDATGDDKAGRCGLETAAGAAAEVGTALGVGAAAPPPQAALITTLNAAHAISDVRAGMRRVLRVKRTLASPVVSDGEGVYRGRCHYRKPLDVALAQLDTIVRRLAN
jgi:hypothetical protein